MDFFNQPDSYVNLDDIVWAISKEMITEKKPCEFCAGQGIITGKDMSTQECPTCKGKKQMDTEVVFEWKVFRRFKVEEIIIVFKSRNGQHSSNVMCKYQEFTFPQENCFGTELEAREACDKLNSTPNYNF